MLPAPFSVLKHSFNNVIALTAWLCRFCRLLLLLLGAQLYLHHVFLRPPKPGCDISGILSASDSTSFSGFLVALFFLRRVCVTRHHHSPADLDSRHLPAFHFAAPTAGRPGSGPVRSASTARRLSSPSASPSGGVIGDTRRADRARCADSDMSPRRPRAPLSPASRPPFTEMPRHHRRRRPGRSAGSATGLSPPAATPSDTGTALSMSAPARATGGTTSPPRRLAKVPTVLRRGAQCRQAWRVEGGQAITGCPAAACSLGLPRGMLHSTSRWRLMRGFPRCGPAQLSRSGFRRHWCAPPPSPSMPAKHWSLSAKIGARLGGGRLGVPAGARSRRSLCPSRTPGARRTRTVSLP